MAISIVPKSSLSLFQNQQGLAGSDSVAVLNTHFEDMSGARSFHFVLHFHGFHHDQAGAYIYRVALLDEQADYLARHGRGDVLASAAEGRFRAFGGIARVADFDPKAAAVGLCFAGQADFEAAAIDQDGKHARLDFLRAVELIFIDLDSASVYDDLPLHRRRWLRPSVSQLLALDVDVSVCLAPLRDAPAAAARATASSTCGAGSLGGVLRVMRSATNPVWRAALWNSGSRRISRKKETLVWTPRMAYSESARSSRRVTQSRPGAHATSFASKGSYSSGTCQPA